MSDDWLALVARVREGGDPLRSVDLGSLYALAQRDGLAALAPFEVRLGRERLIDLIGDVLCDQSVAVLDAESPRAFFLTALQRRAVAWVRRADTAATADARAEEPAAKPLAEEETRNFLLEVQAALAQLSPRGRDIFMAVMAGVDRATVAAEFSTSRAGVDHIVRRVREFLREAQS